jgi:hypothetical protein
MMLAGGFLFGWHLHRIHTNWPGITLGLYRLLQSWADHVTCLFLIYFLSIPVLLVLLLAAAFIGDCDFKQRKNVITAAIIGVVMAAHVARIIRSETCAWKIKAFFGLQSTDCRLQNYNELYFTQSVTHISRGNGNRFCGCLAADLF